MSALNLAHARSRVSIGGGRHFDNVLRSFVLSLRVRLLETCQVFCRIAPSKPLQLQLLARGPARVGHPCFSVSLARSAAWDPFP